MKSLLIVTAFGAEYQALWEPLQNRQIIYTRDVNGYAATRGILGGISVDLIVTGVGREAVGNYLGQFLEFHRPTGAICTGFCGGLSHGAKIGTLVLPDRCILEEGRSFSPTQELRQQIVKGFFEKDVKFLVGDILTNEKIVESVEERKRLNATTSAVAVDMEAATFAELCEAKKLPWFVMKTVMDDLTSQNFTKDGLKPGLEIAKKSLLANLETLISILKTQWQL